MSRKGQSSNDTTPNFYTKQQLLDAAKAHRVKVSGWQFNEWRQAGYIPEPVSDDGAKQVGSGRPPARYPASALDAVLWLGTHRSRIDGDKIVRFWMWLEGFEHVQVDPLAIVRTCLHARWERTRGHLSDLPNIEDIVRGGVPAERQETIAEQLEGLVQRSQESSESDSLEESVAPVSTLSLAGLGILPADHIKGGVDGETGYHIESVFHEIFSPEARPPDFDAWTQDKFPSVIEAGSLVALGRALDNRSLSMDELRAMWQLLDGGILSAAWPAPLTPSFRRFIEKAGKTRHDSLSWFVRLYGYDPLALALLALGVRRILQDISPALLTQFVKIAHSLQEKEETVRES